MTLERASQALRRFEGHQRLGASRLRFQHSTQVAGRARQEADESEVDSRQAGNRERGDHGRSAGDGNDLVAGLASCRRQVDAWVADRGRACVRNERHVAVVEVVKDLGDATGFVVVVIADRLDGDAMMVEQNARGARVLRGNQADFPQHAQSAQGHIFQVAYRRRDDEESAHRCSLF